MTAQATPSADPSAQPASPPETGDAVHEPLAAAYANDSEEMTDMKLAMMDSAELATRAAGLAATAGGDLRQASRDLLASYRRQRNFSIGLLIICGSLMLGSVGVFAFMSKRLQARITQLDDMVLVVGKRVVGMDASMETVGSVQQALQELLAKQQAATELQTKIDARLEEAIKSAQGVPERTAAQLDGKTQTMVKQVQALDSRLQAQASTLNRLSTQLKGLQGAVGDTGAVRRELEAQARQQRERQSADAAALAAAAAAARNRERMVTYPRTSAEKPVSP
jgi:hypothetical protein